MLFQNDETPFSRLNGNIHKLNMLFNMVGDTSIGIRAYIQMAYCFVVILHIFDVYVIKDFTLVDPYFVTATIILYFLLYCTNVTMLFTSGWFTEKIQLFLRNPLRFRVPVENRDDVSEIEREQEREQFIQRGLGDMTMPRNVKDFEIGAFASATVVRSMWMSLLTMLP